MGRSAQRSKEGRRQGFAEHCSALPKPACHAGQAVGEGAGTAPTGDMSGAECPTVPFAHETSKTTQSCICFAWLSFASVKTKAATIMVTNISVKAVR